MKTSRPRYPYPFQLVLIPALRALFGIPSSPSRVAESLLPHVRPQPRVLNAQNIPAESSFVLVMNHYDRPGLGAWWGVMVILRAVAQRRTREPRDVHFAMAREWWYPGGLGRLIKQPLTKWFFGQIEKAYSTIRLPPVVDSGEYKGEGVMPIRKAIALLRRSDAEMIGISIEGRTGPDLSLCEPPRGAGLFLLLLTRDAVPVLPVGIFEDSDQALTVDFGPPFQLHVSRLLPREERDREAARRVMVAIGETLPERMWGVYRQEIAAIRGKTE